MRTVDVIANNLANSSTTGFKADHLYYRSVESAELDALRLADFQTDPATVPGAPAHTGVTAPADQTTQVVESLLPSRALGVTTGGMMSFNSGSIRQTDRSLDVALAGDGFLVVQTPRGERYTRDGALALDSSGQLVTLQGDLVVGEGGPITVRPGEVSIGEDGSVTVAGQVLGQLKLVRFQEPRTALLKEGHTLFAATGSERPLEAPETRVQQGMLESSNVNVVGEMAAMIQNNREFESLQRSVTIMMSLRKVAGEIGKI